MFALTEEIANKLRAGLWRLSGEQTLSEGHSGEWWLLNPSGVAKLLRQFAVVVFDSGPRFDLHDLDLLDSFEGWSSEWPAAEPITAILLSDIDDFGRWYLANHSAGESPWFDYILAEGGDILINNRKEAVA